MINKTINAVIAALYTEFGDDYSYSVEQDEQDLSTPCFEVGLVRPISHGGFWNTHNRVMPIVIHYYPNDEVHPRRECYAIGERALEAVEMITIEDVKIPGNELEIQMVDNVLQIFVTYDFWTKTLAPEKDPMEEIDSHTTVENN